MACVFYGMPILAENKENDKFFKIIKSSGHIVTLRKSKGEDILGACGQLKTESERKKKALIN